VGRVEPLLKRGYTVFAVVHGSMPKYEIREITADFHRAVRFIRHHGKDFGIDPNRLGISGGSSGGSLSLLIGTTGRVSNPKARDPVERQSSRVQAVACFYPGTDWVNFEREGISVLGVCRRLGLIEGFRFRRFDPKAKEHVLITDPKKVEDLLREYSPINRVTAESAPTLIIHGDKDDLVPLDQSERMIAKLQAADVTAELVVKEGGRHGWAATAKDMEHFADWFNKHLTQNRR
jgi:acetyl esterase/lipase